MPRLLRHWCAIAIFGSFSSRSAHAESPAPDPSLAPPADVAAPPANARKTKSGLSLKVIEPGTGNRHPQRNDCVRLRYTAWSRDGQLAGRSSNQAEGEYQCLRQMSPGFAEAVASMVVDERARIWIPQALAFPPNPKQDPPAKQADLTFEIVILSLIAAPPTPKALRRPPSSALKLPSGVALQTLKKGRDSSSPTDSGHVKAHLSCWSTDGTLFESTVMAGQPVVFGMREIPPGLREGLQRMHPAEKARLWVPAALAYGDKPLRRGQPAGSLVYELELLEVMP